MEPKEKAKNLIEDFLTQIHSQDVDNNYEKAKRCALICADEIIHSFKFCYPARYYFSCFYWEKVKEELNKL